jgi:methyl-accepting chemotaxis protein
MRMMKVTKDRSASMNFLDHTQIGRIVFRVISDTAGLELSKIEAELTRQLNAILGENEHDGTEVLTHPCVGGIPADAIAKMKRVLGKLFLHLQRALVLNLAQSLSERLAIPINEIAEKVAEVEKDNEQLGNEVTNLRETLSHLSDRIKEYEKMPTLRGEMKGEAESHDSEKISMSIDRLVGRTHQLTEMLEELSRKYLELREENSRFKQTNSI